MFVKLAVNNVNKVNDVNNVNNIANVKNVNLFRSPEEIPGQLETSSVGRTLVPQEADSDSGTVHCA